jgi:hypothetical protein
MAAIADKTSRRLAQTLDFGVVPLAAGKHTRCVTLFNIGDTTLTVALQSQHHAIKCTYLVRIYPRTANTVEITLEVNPKEAICKGNINGIIELVSSDFQDCSINVAAFVGQPLFFTVYDFVFFKTCRLGERDVLTLELINESQYTFTITSKKSKTQEGRKSKIISTLDDAAVKVEAMSMIPVTFCYEAHDIGPLLLEFDIQMIKPFYMTTKVAFNDKSLKVAGMCIEPKSYERGATDPNGVEFLRQWVSHSSRIVDEYPNLAEREKKFDLSMQSNTEKSKKEVYLNNGLPVLSLMPGNPFYYSFIFTCSRYSTH